jgi:hypothetical protein
MDPSEAQSRAIIAAALIVRGAVEIPSRDASVIDEAAMRLRDLTDHVYRVVTGDVGDDRSVPRP